MTKSSTLTTGETNGPMPGQIELHELVVAEEMPAPLTLSLKPGTVAQVKVPEERLACRLVQVIMGECPPADGTVTIAGQDLRLAERHQLMQLRSRLALVSPQAGLIANLKLWENITLPLLYHQGSVSQEAEHRALALLGSLGYTGSVWSLPGHLSAYERTVTCFVRAAVISPLAVIYAGCLAELSAAQRGCLLDSVAALHGEIDAPAALFISVGDEPLAPLQADHCCDLRSRQHHR